ncbi:MAG: hypothetical protein WA865_14910 [Spirulinaceae cyanobacterium]
MSRSSSSIGPLSIGNVVNASLRLYRDNLKTYLSIALTASLWAFSPFLFGLLIVALIALNVGTNTSLIPAIILAFLVWLVAVFYCGAKSLKNYALISRLAFGMLADQPETRTVASESIQPKMWDFLQVQVLLSLFMGLINFGLSLAQSLTVGLLTSILAGILGRNNPLVFLITVVGQFLILGVYLWVYARFFIPEVPLAMETKVSSADALNRSWSLSKGMARQIALIVFVAFLITLPIYLIASVPLFIAIGSILASFGGILGAGVGLSPAALVPTLIGPILLTVLFFFAANVATLAFWQIIKAVIYYDLRNRKEGLDLQLRDTV